MGYKDDRVTEFRLPLEKGELGRVEKFSFLQRSRSSYSYGILHHSLTCEETGYFPKMVHHCGLQSVFLHYGLTIQARRMTGVIIFNHLGHTTQLLCGHSTLTTGQDSERFQSPFTIGLDLPRAYSFVIRDPHGAQNTDVRDVLVKSLVKKLGIF